jgi:hypothetical protein
MTEKFLTLFVTDAAINQDQPVPLFNQQTTHSPGTQIIVVRRVGVVPDYFRNHPKHSATI